MKKIGLDWLGVVVSAQVQELGMRVPTLAMGPSALSQADPDSMAHSCSLSSGHMQEPSWDHSKICELPAHCARVHSVSWSC